MDKLTRKALATLSTPDFLAHQRALTAAIGQISIRQPGWQAHHDTLKAYQREITRESRRRWPVSR